MNEIQWSDKFYDKFMNDTYIDVGDIWYHKYIWWLIDKNYGKVKRLDKFLSDQLKNPNKVLVETAKNFQTGSWDNRIIKILKFVYKDVKYKSDYDVWGNSEYWATAIETLDKGTDDCDGLNALIYILARLAGIPKFTLWCNIGQTAHGGHFWLTYYSDGNWYAIDSTYYPDTRPINFRPEFKLDVKTYQDIWHVWNEDRVYRYKKEKVIP